MRRFAGSAVPEVGRIQASSELGGDFALDQRPFHDMPQLRGNLAKACQGGDAGRLERFLGADHPLGCIPVRQGGSGDENLRQIGAPVVMRRRP